MNKMIKYVLLSLLLSLSLTLLILATTFRPQKPPPKLENLGTFLITKFNENEKSCPGKIMANGKTVYVGAVAISPDIRDSGLLIFGDKILIDGYGEFTVACLTHRRLKRTIDIYTDNYTEAKKGGAVRKRVWLIQNDDR